MKLASTAVLFVTSIPVVSSAPWLRSTSTSTNTNTATSAQPRRRLDLESCYNATVDVFDPSTDLETGNAIVAARDEDWPALLFDCPPAVPNETVACYVDYLTVPSHSAYSEFCTQYQGLPSYDHYYLSCSSETYGAMAELAVVNSNIGCLDPTACTLEDFLTRTPTIKGIYEGRLSGNITDMVCDETWIVTTEPRSLDTFNTTFPLDAYYLDVAANAGMVEISPFEEESASQDNEGGKGKDKDKDRDSEDSEEEDAMAEESSEDIID